MKTKLLTVTAFLAALFINAAHAGPGSVSLDYSTNTFSKGSVLTDESVLTSVSYATEVEGLNVDGYFSSANELSDEQSVYVFSGGLSNSVGELLDVYVGLQHEEIIDGTSQLDAVIKLDFNCPLSPYFLIMRETTDDNHVFEAGVSHVFSLDFADLTLLGLLGSADRYGLEDNAYHSIGANLSKNLSDSVAASVGYNRVNSDSMSGEDVVSAGFTFSF
tara:strand:+ start:80 stop:733 length:654 start_codon:yes stop_codon:yes gene_type:complete